MSRRGEGRGKEGETNMMGKKSATPRTKTWSEIKGVVGVETKTEEATRKTKMRLSRGARGSCLNVGHRYWVGPPREKEATAVARNIVARRRGSGGCAWKAGRRRRSRRGRRWSGKGDYAWSVQPRAPEIKCGRVVETLAGRAGGREGVKSRRKRTMPRGNKEERRRVRHAQGRKKGYTITHTIVETITEKVGRAREKRGGGKGGAMRRGAAISRGGDPHRCAAGGGRGMKKEVVADEERGKGVGVGAVTGPMTGTMAGRVGVGVTRQGTKSGGVSLRR
jgi:hypothetical protein